MIELEEGTLLTRLLAGEFICAICDERAFRQLKDESRRERIDAYLRPLNRRLASNADESVYFLAWLQLDDNIRQQLSRQLGETVNSLLPMLEWMLLVQESLGRDGTVSAGDVLKPAEFSARCEDNQGLRERVEQLAATPFFRSQSEQLDGQIKLIFKRLKEHGYLIQPHHERQVYLVTGKIDYLLDLMIFIRDEEQLPVEEESSTVLQAGLW